MAGGNLPFGLAPSGSLTSYTPTLRERATDWVRRTLFSDDREGQGRAAKVMDVASVTPFGFGLDVYDAGREAGLGNYGTAGLMLGMAGAPGPGPRGKPFGFTAYHGSPHDFPAERLVRLQDGRTEYLVGMPDVLPDVPEGAEILQEFPLGRMRMDKIGTGEGAQAYGHGLYNAEAEDVARGYRDALAPGMGDGALRAAGMSDSDLRSMRQFTQSAVDPDVALRDWLGWTRKSETPEIRAAFMQEWNGRNPGKMYEVEINADPDTFLDWDKPLSEQPDVQAKLATIGEAARSTTSKGMDKYISLENMLGNRAAVTDKLREAGIPGIKYLDAGSRPTTKADSFARQFGSRDEALTAARQALASARGRDSIHWQDLVSELETPQTRNYVVFDDKLISIVRKYGIAGASAMLGYNILDGMDPAQADELKRIEGNQ